MEFHKVGFMLSEARATAFGLLANVAKEILDEDFYGVTDAEYEYLTVPVPLMDKLKETYEALMGIVEEEESGFKTAAKGSEASYMSAGEDVHRPECQEPIADECIPNDEQGTPHD